MILALAVLGVMVGARAQTEDPDHAAHHADAQPPVAAPSAPDAPPPGSMQAGMKRIQDLMSQIQQTADSVQRRELMSRHLTALRDQIRAMRAAASRKMAMMREDKVPADRAREEDDPHAGHRQDEAPGKAEGQKKPMMMGGGMMKMHKRVEQRLDAIEQILEQMIEREVVERAAP
jgi:hypothetical protein